MQLTLYTDAQVKKMINQLGDVDVYKEVLQLERAEAAQQQVPQAAETEGQKLLDGVSNLSRHIEGRKPPAHLTLAAYDTQANRIYGLQNHQELSKLMDYLRLNGGYTLQPVQNRGACMFASVRRSVNAPLEYSNTHLRRQVVAFICSHIVFLWPLLLVHIKGNYGQLRLSKEDFQAKDKDGTLTQQERQDYSEPGPFSLVSYCQQLLKSGFWGEEIVLVLLSMMWQVRITVLHAETLLQTKIRHINALVSTDIVLVRCGGNHYVPAGKYHMLVSALR